MGKLEVLIVLLLFTKFSPINGTCHKVWNDDTGCATTGVLTSIISDCDLDSDVIAATAITTASARMATIPTYIHSTHGNTWAGCAIGG